MESVKVEDNTTGEAIAGMINSFGFSDRPISLTPQFFESTEGLLISGIRDKNICSNQAIRSKL